MVGSLLSRARQLTSEAKPGRSVNMKLHLKRIAPIFLSLLILLSATSIYAAKGNTSYTTLKVGSRGDKVSLLQQTLNKKGFSAGRADGIYGKNTKNAVIKFQKANKIAVDGIAGKQTQSILYSAPQASKTTSSRGTSISRNAYQTNLYWLSRIIEAEAGAEPYSGKVAIGNVILNRVASNSFPNTVKGVIFDYYGNIPQFSPVAEGTIYNTPSEASIKAAVDALNGKKPVGSSTYFFNPKKAEGKWIVKNKTYVTKIGEHVFYK